MRTATVEARGVPALDIKRENQSIKTRALLLTIWLVAALLVTASLPGAQLAAGALRSANILSPTNTPSCQYSDVSTAFAAAVARLNQDAPPDEPFVLHRIAVQGRWAYGVARQLDPSGRPIPYQIAVLLAAADDSDSWCALVPDIDPPADYNRALADLPASLLDEATVAWLHQPEPPAGIDNLSGHRLPWPGGQYAYVTQRDGPYHQNQVDFDILGWNRYGDVVASRPGQVVFVKESSSTGCCDISCWEQANMVVIQHAGDEFTWYVHLAYDSVPVSVGQWVDIGTPIGVEGNTGYSCGVHLHFMASADHTPWTDPQDPDQAPWGLEIIAVDFDESPWLDLIPGLSYTSQNYLTTCHIYVPIASLLLGADG